MQELPRRNELSEAEEHVEINGLGELADSDRGLELINVLVVDDQPEVLEAIGKSLSSEGVYCIHSASNGEDAVAVAKATDFAVIVMDINMPGLNGFQTADKIRAGVSNKSVPFIFMTGMMDPEYSSQSYQFGAVDFLIKPFDMFILVAKVAVFANLKRLQGQIKYQDEQLRRQEAERHAVELEALRKSGAESVRFLADSIPHLLLRLDESLNVITANARWQVYDSAVEDGEITGPLFPSGWQELIPIEDFDNLHTALHQVNEQSPEVEVAVRLLSRHCGEWKLRWHCLRAVADQGHWLCTFSEIHAQKMAEEFHRIAEEKANSANQSKSRFLANMSHEIRTPMNAIIGYSEMMMAKSASLSDEVLSFLGVVRRNAEQVNNVINEILDFSKVEAGSLEVEQIDIDLKSLLGNISSLLKFHVDKKGIVLNVDFFSPVPGHISSDPVRLRQILTNLIGNAVKFTSKGFVQVGISFRTTGISEGVLRFAVTDTGPGIRSRHHERIFEPYLQADSSMTRLFGGTGLGLPLARMVARALGGEVWLDCSRVGVGSTFVFELKLNHFSESDWVSSLDEVDPTTESASLSDKSVLQGARILLADDSEDNRQLLRLFLEHAGASVETARNGAEAYEKALMNNFDLVLMDIQMPIMDGMEATRQLRERGFASPILALTAHAFQEERERCLLAGCDDHLSKPISQRRLVETVDRFIKPASPSPHVSSTPSQPPLLH